MSNASAWALAVTLVCALSLAAVGRRIERAAMAVCAVVAVAHVAFTLDRWSAWEATARHAVYGVSRAAGLTLDRAMEASLAASACALVGALHLAGSERDGVDELRARRAVMAVGVLWGLYAMAGFAWVT